MEGIDISALLSFLELLISRDVLVPALQVFLLVGLGKALGVIAPDKVAASYNAVFSFLFTEGTIIFRSEDEALITVLVMLVSAVFYKIWKVAKPFFAKLATQIKT